MKKNVETVFGFPNIVRFCWSTAELVLKNQAAQVDWWVFSIFVFSYVIVIEWNVKYFLYIIYVFCFRSDDDEDEDKTSVPITSFFGQNGKEVRQKTSFFDDRGLVVTTTI